MKKELREKIYAFNKNRAAKDEKATDLDIIVSEIMKLPSGQLKKILTDPVVAVLKKHGYAE